MNIPITSPDPATRQTLRMTVVVTPVVEAAFKRLSRASGMSVSRAMGEWLGDTVEAAEFMAQKMEQARAAPKIVMREMHAYAMGLADETGDLIRQMQEKGRADRASGRVAVAASAAADTIPPPCNTGGKLPSRSSTKRGKA